METIRQQAAAAIVELLQAAQLMQGELIVLGCSSSEVAGKKIGTAGSPLFAAEILDGIQPVLAQNGILLAVQCCEHLNRALVVERETLYRYNLVQVNALPKPRAGGSTATAAWQMFHDPVLVEDLKVQAGAGLDIGNTLIGMHLRPVVVPVRLSVPSIGLAQVVAARTRPKFVGGERAVYQEELL